MSKVAFEVKGARTMALKDLIASPGEAIIGKLAREYRIEPDVHEMLVTAIDAAAKAERERCAEWLDANGQPGYATEIRHLKD